jgi:hypothetical protein
MKKDKKVDKETKTNSTIKRIRNKEKGNET